MNYKKLLSLAFLITHMGFASAGLPDALEAVKRNDLNSAIGELRPLAEQGSTEAQALLARVLFARRENLQDIAEAIDLLTKAADSGHQNAMLILADMYSKGANVKKDEQESVKWLRRLAERNNPIGLVLLAKKYDEGLGVPQSAFISRALLTVSGYVPESQSSEIRGVSDLFDRFGPLSLALITNLADEMSKPANLLKALDAANSEATTFNKKYASLPLAVKEGIIDAEAGNDKFIVKLGILYLYGEAGVPRDPKRAAYWFQKAASKGDRDGMDSMARLYLAGIGVDQNYSIAFELFSKLAKKGNPSSAAQLGIMYKEGLGVSQDFTQALYWLRKSFSRGGESESLYPLAQMYSLGSGVERNLIVALALAKYSVNIYPYSSRLGLPSTDNPAIVLVQELKSKLSPHDVAVSSILAGQFVTASLDGDLLAAIDLALKNDGKDYQMSSVEVASSILNKDENEDFPLVLNLLEPLINFGDPAAQYLMGTMYEKGKGVALDKKKANNFFELAERQGNVDALKLKAGIYERGEGVQQDFSKAFSLFKKAGERGDAFAQVKCADMLAEGKGVDRNAEKAEFWYEQALANREDFWRSDARNGLAKVFFSQKKYVDAARNFKLAAAAGRKDAQLILAKMYFEGIGIPRSLQLAYALAKVAQRDEKHQTKESQFSEDVKKNMLLTELAPTNSLVVILSKLVGYSHINKKDSAEFLRVINEIETSVIR